MSGATDNLRDNQKQLDADGCMVGVSRQAVVEVLDELQTEITQNCRFRDALHEIKADLEVSRTACGLFEQAAKSWEGRATKAEAALLGLLACIDRCDDGAAWRCADAEQAARAALGPPL